MTSTASKSPQSNTAGSETPDEPPTMRLNLSLIEIIVKISIEMKINQLIIIINPK